MVQNGNYVFITMRGPCSPSLNLHGGLLRWHIHYNLLVLRMISFASDLHWARTRCPLPRLDDKQVDESKVRMVHAPRLKPS